MDSFRPIAWLPRPRATRSKISTSRRYRGLGRNFHVSFAWYRPGRVTHRRDRLRDTGIAHPTVPAGKAGN